MTIMINEEKCSGCGRCRDVCPVGAIALVNGKAVINNTCIDCGACITVCRNKAISLHLVKKSPVISVKNEKDIQGQSKFEKRKSRYHGQCKAKCTDSVRYCICSNCGEKRIHMKGIPCNLMNCPICGMPMRRDLRVNSTIRIND